VIDVVCAPAHGSAWCGAAFDGVINTVGGQTASAVAVAAKPDGIIVSAATDPFCRSAQLAGQAVRAVCVMARIRTRRS